MAQWFECWHARARWRHHLELVHDLDSLPHIQRQWTELGLDVDLAFLPNLVLRDNVKVRERLVHEGGHVSGLLQDLCVRVIVNEGKQLIENLLDVGDFFKIARNHRHLGQQSLLLTSELLVKLSLELHLLLIQLAE